MRIAAGCEDCSHEEPIQDQTLRGLETLLDILPRLDIENRQKMAILLWEALGDLVEKRGTNCFSGIYRWRYVSSRSTTFDAAFVQKLNEIAWVPDVNGELQRPEFILFETLGWESNPFLLSKIRFKPPIIEALAREAGIEPGILDLLKKHGLTSEAELRARLGIKDEVLEPDEKHPDSRETEDTQEERPDGRREKTTSTASAQNNDNSGRGDSTTPDSVKETANGKGGDEKHHRPIAKPREHPFISYIAVQPDEEEPDPDGLDQTARMALEEAAIQFILQREMQLHRTPSNNPGFDLFETEGDEQIIRWVEVKAMSGGLNDRPVGLSHTQFECAQMRGNSYWLYVVEYAGSLENSRIVRIQDPAGRAKTFTFDHGWLTVADICDKEKYLQ
jgi:hypothetical protein